MEDTPVVNANESSIFAQFEVQTSRTDITFRMMCALRRLQPQRGLITRPTDCKISTMTIPLVSCSKLALPLSIFLDTMSRYICNCVVCSLILLCHNCSPWYCVCHLIDPAGLPGSIKWHTQYQSKISTLQTNQPSYCACRDTPVYARILVIDSTAVIM